MSSKVIGALLILGAGGGLLVQLWRQSRAEILFLQDMASALEQMEAAIRFRRLPMPELLREQVARQCCGGLFLQIIQNMKRGETLQNSWTLAARSIPWTQAADTLCALELSGDEQRLGENLRACADSLHAVLRCRQADKQQRQKMALAITASCCGLLVILLL